MISRRQNENGNGNGKEAAARTSAYGDRVQSSSRGYLTSKVGVDTSQHDGGVAGERSTQVLRVIPEPIADTSKQTLGG